MNIKSIVAAASLCLLPLCSQAGVLYQWTATNGETPRGITLSMEFDNRTVKRGEFQIDIENDSELKVPKRGLLGLHYTFPGMHEKMVYTSKGGAGFGLGRGYLAMDLQFDADGYLTGSIYANDSNSDIYLVGSGGAFTVIDANSDESMPGAGCGWHFEPAVQCVGATGNIQRVRATEVPEPSTIALLSLGAAGWASSRRRKSVK